MPERYSTAKSYRSNIVNHLKPRWGDYLLDRIRPMAVEDWLKNLDMAPKSKAHFEKRDAPDVSVCRTLGTLHRAEKPDCVGSR